MPEECGSARSYFWTAPSCLARVTLSLDFSGTSASSHSRSDTRHTQHNKHTSTHTHTQHNTHTRRCSSILAMLMMSLCKYLLLNLGSTGQHSVSGNHSYSLWRTNT